MPVSDNSGHVPATYEHTRATCLGSVDDDVRAAWWVAGIEMARDGLMPIRELQRWIDAFATSEPDRQVGDVLGMAGLADAANGALPPARRGGVMVVQRCTSMYR